MIHFQANKPLQAALVRKLIKARITENVGREQGTATSGFAFARCAC
jgi:hypothetical protein